MLIDTNAIVTATEANQKLLVIDLDTEPQIELSEDEKFQIVTQRILKEHKAAFEELAK